jgi:hypothetical protein
MSTRNSGRKPAAAAQKSTPEKQTPSAELSAQPLKKAKNSSSEEEENKTKKIIFDGNATDLLAGQMSSEGVTSSKNMATDLDFGSQSSDVEVNRMLHFPAAAIG